MKTTSCEFLIQNAFRQQVSPSATPADGESRSLKEGAAHMWHVTIFTGKGVPCLDDSVITWARQASRWPYLLRNGLDPTRHLPLKVMHVHHALLPVYTLYFDSLCLSSPALPYNRTSFYLFLFLCSTFALWIAWLLFCMCTPLAGANIWTSSFELYIILCADNVAQIRSSLLDYLSAAAAFWGSWRVFRGLLQQPDNI